MSQLKACPFCGKATADYDANGHAIYCFNCNAVGPETLQVSLHFICPFTGLKFAFHRQDQVDMLQKHFEFLAAKAEALTRQNEALVGALQSASKSFRRM